MTKTDMLKYEYGDSQIIYRILFFLGIRDY